MSAVTLPEPVVAARKKFMAARGLGTRESCTPKRWIQTHSKVFEYGGLQAAEIALPRIRRTDPTARIIPEEQEYDVLRRTPPSQLVLLEAGRKAS